MGQRLRQLLIAAQMPRPKIPRRWSLGLLAGLTLFQLLCAAFFISEFLTEVLHLRHWALPFAWREILQILASLGLAIGSVTSLLLLRQSRRRMVAMHRQVRAASGAFHEVMDEFFDDWALSPSERDVAMFALRGFGNAEIATLRGKSEATIKTQINAVFRKAGVASRAQLMGVFVDAMMVSGDQDNMRAPQNPMPHIAQA